MPSLGDYLGHLLAEITTARVQADLETVRVADLYASHPLLRNMAVPRFRLPSVTIDAPVVVTRMEEAAAGQPLRGGIGLGDVHAALDRALTAALDARPMKMTAKQKNELRRSLTSSTARFAPVAGAAIPRSDIDAIVDAAAEALADRLGSDELAETFRRTLATALAESGHPVPRLHVAVTTGELREAGPPELLARLRLTVSEEAMEWSVSESKSRLVVE